MTQKLCYSAHHPWFFGIRFALLIVAWDVSRVLAAFRLILPTSHPGYRKEHTLFREMLRAFQPPAWAEQVLVEGDAAYGAKANINLVTQLDKADAARSWNVVFAIARTWKTTDDKSLKHLVTHVPRQYDTRTWIPRLSAWRYRQTSWVSAKRLCLRDMGDVTLVLSTTGRNVGPGHTKRLVTNLPHVPARQVVWLYQNRWSVERVNRDLQSALGVGEHQVRGDHDRIEKSCGIAILASLFVLRMCQHEITPGQPWSLSGLQHSLRLRVITNQVAHNVRCKLAPQRKVA
jgi:hypothetical protein